MSILRVRAINFVSGVLLGLVLTFPATPALAQVGGVIMTPDVIPELPIEVETEVGPAGSLKIIPLWKETIELLEDPHGYDCPNADDPATQADERVECFSTTERRPFFGPPGDGAEDPDGMPPLRVFDACHNVLTGQPLRTRPDDELDWNQPGYLFDPDEVVDVVDPSQSGGNVSNIPSELRTPIGALVSCAGPGVEIETQFSAGDPCRHAEAGDLVISNPFGNNSRNMLALGTDGLGPPPASDSRLPVHRTVIAKSACNAAGQLIAEDEDTGVIGVVDELEQPVNETHFIRDRLAAEVLGKALFWDMQVGSDGVQACGSCHAFAGVDHRTRNQLNPNTLGGDLILHLRGLSVQNTNAIDVVADDFPFHRKRDRDLSDNTTEATNCGHDGLGGCGPGNVRRDSNDVMSSMGVSEFKQFDDVLINNTTAFGPAAMGVRPLSPDAGTANPDPVPVMQGNRRIEPRHTPTMHAAAFNFDNFWDGRARHDYNGGSVFGPADPFFHIHVSCGADPNTRELLPLAAPIEAEFEPGPRPLCDWTEAGGNYLGADEGEEPVPVRIRFSSLASQAMGPPLSEFEMAFGFVDPDILGGRNWAKIGKKMLQGRIPPEPNAQGGGRWVTPLAKQLVDITDSRIGPWSNQGGSECAARGRPTAVGKPGLCTTYRELIRLAFRPELWGHRNNIGPHFAGTDVPMNNACAPGDQIHEDGVQATCDPFDGYVLAVTEPGPIGFLDPDEFKLEEANFSLFFGLSVQAYEQLLIPDETPWDKFNDLYPLLGNGVGQPGEQTTLPPDQVRELVTGSSNPNVFLRPGLVEGMDQDVLFGFDIFAGGNLTAALAPGSRRNPGGVGSNPFLRTGRCMLCHLGPEQSDHTNNVNAGLLQSGTEQEFPFPQFAPEPTGIIRLVTGFSLAEELEENAQDGVEVENRNFLIFGDDLTIPPGCVPMPGFPNGTDCTSPENAQIAPSSATAFQDNGIYNIGLRPTMDDFLRGGDDPFGFPLALSALALKNLGGEAFEPCDTESEVAGHPTGCALPNFDPALGVGGGLYETVGDCVGCDFEDENGNPTGYFQESVNPGLQLEPAEPMLPEYLAEWANNLPAGEANPLIDELAFAPNTITQTPAAEYTEILFGSDQMCGVFLPDPPPDGFGSGPPNFGWGALDADGDPVLSPSGASICPNSQTGVPPNMGLGNGPYVPGSLVAPPNGTWGTTPFANRVARDGAAKVPQLRNVELTGPYFHTGSYLTLRQTVDFYMRGGDFPVTNSEDRDPNLVNVDVQAFGFGSTLDLAPLFLDGIPDTITRYGSMPDFNPPGCQGDAPNCTPEPALSTPEQAKRALVKFMLALTDERVAFRSAPFDQPEIFVPIDGQAPQNDFGRMELVDFSGVPCTMVSIGPCFQQIPATGRAGQDTRVPNFLGISSTPMGGPNNDHFDR